MCASFSRAETMASPAEEQARLDALTAEIRACTICAKHLPLGPRPVLRGQATARLLILSQAPGTRVHVTGLSFNDRSGDRLREWLDVSRKTFYDESRVAITPMGFCYPGRDAKGGDLPPRPECAPTWLAPLLERLPHLELILLVGSYAIDDHLRGRTKSSMTATVQAWREYLPRYLPLPHPSWRNTGWLKRNPWFASELLPELRKKVRALL
jgi:uracil-DNA glycosylase